MPLCRTVRLLGREDLAEFHPEVPRARSRLQLAHADLLAANDRLAQRQCGAVVKKSATVAVSRVGPGCSVGGDGVPGAGGIDRRSSNLAF
jgi:hypothetical protein